MKKQLLLGSALLAAISAFPQTGRTDKFQPKMVDMTQKIAQKYESLNRSVEPSPFNAPATQTGHSVNQGRLTSVANATISSWKAITGSENVYGVLVSNSKPLQYNDELGYISFVHRKSHTYNASPLPAATASTGVIVAEITSSWGQNWDSTCIWNNNTSWGRYPQGGIYNPVGNTHGYNAYIVGTGPVTDGNTTAGWRGNWYASKKIDTLHGANYTNVAGTGPSQQFISNTTNFGNAGKIDFARLDFSATDDGVLRTLGVLATNVNGTGAAAGYMGGRILKGTFNSSTNAIDWNGVHDSLIPPVYVNTATGNKEYLADPHMAWNEAGDIGYVWFIGSRIGTTGNNVGYQPIIKKTIDGGATWSNWSGIDFNAPNMKATVLSRIDSVKGQHKWIPFFNFTEGIDGVVDNSGKLHLVATIWATSKSHPDSVSYTYSYPNNWDFETYTYSHTPGRRPYIFDFVGDNTNPWSVILVDSMSSENLSGTPTDNGFSTNPWDHTGDGGTAVGVDARIQASRTPDGKYIVYTWAESDTANTTGNKKWNEIPNIKARLLTVATGVVHPNEINVTNPSTNFNVLVRNAAYNHYTSPKCALSTNTASGIAVIVPMTVTNNSPLRQLEPVNHWYSSAILNFDNLSYVIPPYGPDYKATVGIAENALNSASNSVIYPNPAKNNAVLSIDMKNNSKVDVSVMNLVGQQVKANQAEAQIGQNNINIDLSGLASGIYMVNVKVGSASSTKKLVVE